MMGLLALSAVEILSTEDEQQLSQLLTKYPEFSKDEFAKTTALSQIGFYLTDHTAHEKLPSALRDRILVAYENAKSSEKNNPLLSILTRLLKAFRHTFVSKESSRNFPRNSILRKWSFEEGPHSRPPTPPPASGDSARRRKRLYNGSPNHETVSRF